MLLNRITNGNLYVNANSWLGLVEEVTLPEIKAKLAEHKALGMVGVVEFPTGFEKMEAQVKMTSYDAGAMALAGDIFTTQNFQLLANMQTHGAGGVIADVPVAVFMTGTFKNLPLGGFKAQEQVDLTLQLNITYVKLVINDVDIMEFDAVTNIYRIMGVDKLLTYRTNLGL